MTLVGYKELDIKVPEGIEFVDNGAYDLEEDGITGYYTWVGYKFNDKDHLATRLDSELEIFVNDVVKDAFKSLFGVSNNEVIIEDRRNISNLFRVWVATYEK